MLAATSRGRQNLWDATGLSRGGSRILLTCLGLVNKERETPPRKAVASLSPAVVPGSSQHENSTGQAGGISNVFRPSLSAGDQRQLGTRNRFNGCCSVKAVRLLNTRELRQPAGRKTVETVS